MNDRDSPEAADSLPSVFTTEPRVDVTCQGNPEGFFANRDQIKVPTLCAEEMIQDREQMQPLPQLFVCFWL